LRTAVANHDTVVLMKVNRALLEAMAELDDLGLEGKSIYVKRASTDGEEVVRDLGKLAGEKLDYFSLLIIRK
jgi:precorrin-2/cobalt-factor-2 C20-methyltransferase